MAPPWLGFVDPLVLESTTPVALAGPPALDSPQYAADFAEVRDYGGRLPSHRRPDRHRAVPDVAPRFQYIAAIRDQVTDRDLDIVDSARALALFDGSLADASSPAGRRSTTSTSGVR